VLHNLPAGDWAAGERGIACHPDRVAEFEAGVDHGLLYATALGCRQLNCLAGLRPAGLDGSVARATLIRNLRYAALRLKEAGLLLLTEPVNTRDVPGFFLSSTTEALDILTAVGVDNMFLQFDAYHMHVMGENVIASVSQHRERIRHIQIADAPGRHEPGTGTIEFPALFAAIERSGYAGWIGCEYNPSGDTRRGLGWTKAYLPTREESR
jgi:hydroxypyruvate isomerase